MNKIKKIEITSENKILSCNYKTPLVKLPETGNPPILNYTLPQSTCFDAIGIIPIDISPSSFKYLEDLPINGNSNGETNEYDFNGFFSKYAGILHSYVTKFEIPATNEDLYNYNDFNIHFKNLLISENFPDHILWVNEQDSNIRFSVWEIFHNMAESYSNDSDFIPQFQTNLAGNLEIKAVKKIEKLVVIEKPQIFLIEHYKICSFIGDYGAGKVLKTFSLLPGEKTSISIRTFKQKKETKSKSENILDSFSSSSANDLEKILEQENTENNSSSFSSSQTSQSSKTVSKKMSASLSAGAATKASIGGSIGSSTTNSNGRETSLNNARDKNIRILSNSISKQTSKSDAFREVEVNIETTVSLTEELETTIFREIENLNNSRVLNFTFRQLLQGYKTFTYLDKVSLAFTTGNPNSVLIEDLGTSKKLLEEVLYPKQPDQSKSIADEVFNQLIVNYCNVFDYESDKQQFYEEVKETIDDCFFGGDSEEFIYYRKRSKYFEESNKLNPEIGHSLPGIVLNIENRIFRTDSVIVDSLLGHGEALDCFNLELQEATVTKSHLENITLNLNNRKIKEAIEALNSASDPEMKVKIYETIFKEYCKEKIIIKEIDD